MTNRATLEKSIQDMQKNFRADKATGYNVTYRLLLTGDNGGSWGVYVANNQCEVRQGAPRRTDVTITMSIARYLEMAAGTLNLGQSFQKGEINVTGDLQLAMKFVEFFPAWDKGGSGSGSTPPEVVNSSLLNSSFDEYQPFVYEDETKVWKENQYPEMYGKYWQLDVVSRGKGRPHLMDSGTFGQFTARYFGGGGHDYHIEGTHSQVVTSRFQFDIVLRQTVTAQPGRNYSFKGAMVSYYKGTATGPTHDKIFLNIGIDPTGGTDYSSSKIVWSGRDGRNNEWRYPSVGTTAQADKITVFIRLENTEKDVGETELNIIHLDKFALET
jgi:putative sterol carrier protein